MHADGSTNAPDERSIAPSPYNRLYCYFPAYFIVFTREMYDPKADPR